MTLTDLMWLSTACYALHILEEYQLDWRGWARKVLGLPVEWGDFYVVNALVIVIGIVAANLAAHVPALALAFPAVMLVNGTFFHVGPTIKMRGHFSPGVVTAVVLFYPVAIACYWRAFADGVVGGGGVVGSLILGAVLMAYPIALLKIKDRPYFRQDA